VSFEHFSADGAQVADASAALIFLVRFCIKAKMNNKARQRHERPIRLRTLVRRSNPKNHTERPYRRRRQERGDGDLDLCTDPIPDIVAF
jgi:hypothetical protein